MTAEQYRQWLRERGLTDADRMQRAVDCRLLDQPPCEHRRWDEDITARVCFDCKRVIPRD